MSRLFDFGSLHDKPPASRLCEVISALWILSCSFVSYLLLLYTLYATRPEIPRMLSGASRTSHSTNLEIARKDKRIFPLANLQTAVCFNFFECVTSFVYKQNSITIVKCVLQTTINNLASDLPIVNAIAEKARRQRYLQHTSRYCRHKPMQSICLNFTVTTQTTQNCHSSTETKLGRQQQHPN